MLMMNKHFISRGFPQSSVTWYYWNWTELRLIVNMLTFTLFPTAQWQRTEIHDDISVCIHIHIIYSTLSILIIRVRRYMCSIHFANWNSTLVSTLESKRHKLAGQILAPIKDGIIKRFGVPYIPKQCEMLSIKSSPKYLSNHPEHIPGTLFDTNSVYKQRIPKIEILDLFLPCLLLQIAMINSHHVSGQGIGFYLQPSVRRPDFLGGWTHP